MRPEVGFTPRWFHEYCGIDFSETWHEDPDYRLKAHELMGAEVRRRFPGRNINRVEDDDPPDLLTGLYAGAVMPAIMGVGIRYWPDAWPAAHGGMLSEEEADALEPVDLENNAFFQGILRQLDRIEELTGTIRGFLNWQGVLNTTFRLRGEDIFTDLLLDAPSAPVTSSTAWPRRCCVTRPGLHDRQRRPAPTYRFATISNCVVNMVSGEHYREFLLPYDLMLRSKFEKFGIHNCAWVVDAYMEAYAETPDLGYIDMGVSSDLARAKELFPNARRTLLYTAMDMKEKTDEQVREDFERIAREYAPCDLGLPNVDLGIPDDRVKFAMDLCAEMSEKHG